MAAQLLPYVPLIGAVAYAAAVDIRTRRIPNWLTAALAVAGVVQALLMPSATVTVGTSLAGLGVGLLVPFCFFAIRALGPGDVKLLAAIGAWVGVKPVLVIMLAAAVLGGVVAIVQGLMQRRLSLLLGNTALLALNLAQVRRFGAAKLEALGDNPTSMKNTIPYAVPILLATTGFVVGRAIGWN
jgi:prepilin peptidase CpaA